MTLFADLSKSIDQASPAELPAIIGELEQAKAKAWARLSLPQHYPTDPPPRHDSETPDAMVNIHEASKRLGMSVSWLYRNAARQPFAVRVNGHNWRFSTKGIDRYLRTRSTD